MNKSNSFRETTIRLIEQGDYGSVGTQCKKQNKKGRTENTLFLFYSHIS